MLYLNTLLRHASGLSAAALLILAPPTAQAQTDTWIAPANGNWSQAANWSLNQVPNGAGSNYYDVLNSSSYLITHSLSNGPTGEDVINSYDNTGTGGLTVTGGTLTGAKANDGSTFQANGTLLNGASGSATLNNLTVINSNALAFSRGNNYLDNVNLDGGLTFSSPGSVTIQNSLTHAVGASFSLGTSGSIDFYSSDTFANATLDFGNIFSRSVVGVNSGSTLTLDKSLNVTGFDADIVGGTVVNNSLLSSSQGGIWYFDPTTIVNNNTMESRNTGSTFSVSGGTISNTGTIQAVGGGNVSLNAVTLTNTGTLGASNGGTLSVVLNTNLLNNGVIQVGANSSMNLNSFSQQAGSTTVDGTLQSGPMNLELGLLTGNGVVAADVSNTDGTLQPGQGGLGMFTLGSKGIGGNYTQYASGTFLEDLGGYGASSGNGILAAGATARLDGTLKVSLINGFTPKVGDQFTFLTYKSETGYFANILSDLPGYSYSVTYLPTDAVLTVTTAPAAVPEASTIVSFSLLLGLGSLWVARRKKSRD